MTCTLLRNRVITATFLLYLSALSIATAIILDTDGQPLLNGGNYYIISKSLGIEGGLTLKPKTETSPCPFYITRVGDETSPGNGIPVTITSPAKIAFITPSLPISIAFDNDTPTICRQSLRGQVIPDDITGQLYVATGGNRVDKPSFSIEPIGNENNVYKIRRAGESDEVRDVGIFRKDGLLGITDYIPLLVAFKKAVVDF